MVRDTLNPEVQQVPPCRAFPPPAGSPDRREPVVSCVVPEVLILPVKALVSRIVQILPEQPYKCPGCAQRLTRGQSLMVTSDSEFHLNGAIGVLREVRSPVPIVVPAQEQAVTALPVRE